MYRVYFFADVDFNFNEDERLGLKMAAVAVGANPSELFRAISHFRTPSDRHSSSLSLILCHFVQTQDTLIKSGAFKYDMICSNTS